MKNIYTVEANEMYILMIHHAHSLLILSNIKFTSKMSVIDVRNNNYDELNRIHKEVLSTLDYEVTYDQMNASIRLCFKSI